MTSAYTLPRGASSRLRDRLAGRPHADAAMALATYLGRFWSAPGRLGSAFCVDRRGIAGSRHLDLSEWAVRRALELLEEVGFLTRETTKGGAYQRTEAGWRKRPIRFRFAATFGLVLAAANKRVLARRQVLSHKQSAAEKTLYMGETETSPLEMALSRLGRAIETGSRPVESGVAQYSERRRFPLCPKP